MSPDEKLRRLERLAAQGDPLAKERLQQWWRRTCDPRHELEEELRSTVSRALRAYEEATGSWTGLDWDERRTRRLLLFFPCKRCRGEGWVDAVDDEEQDTKAVCPACIGDCGYGEEEEVTVFLGPGAVTSDSDPEAVAGFVLRAPRYQGLREYPDLYEQVEEAIEDMAEEGVEYARQVRSDARHAEGEAAMAVSALEEGEFEEAAERAHEAASTERSYGDSPTWGEFEDLVERAFEINEELEDYDPYFHDPYF